MNVSGGLETKPYTYEGKWKNATRISRVKEKRKKEGIENN